MKRLLLVLQLFVLPTAYSTVEDGQRIYLEGLNDQGQAIKSYINDLDAGAALACVNCHRESGLGTSESGKTIPPVSWSFLGVNQPVDDKSIFYRIQNKRKAYDSKLLHTLLTTGINSNGQAADKLMPRYVISESQTEHLVEYLKTLYSENDPGVDADVINIATFVDPRLSEQQKEQHLQFIQGLFEMKNSLTRGEIKRKRFSPIQKVPQYESYRHWNLVTWELPDDPQLWKQSLTEQYLRQPVFVVLSPLIKDNYPAVGDFCTEMAVPCLFAHGTDSGEGDYFNFVFRNTKKQQKDYLNHKLRDKKNIHLFFDTNGNLQQLQSADMVFPQASELSLSLIHEKLKQVCGADKTIILRSDLALAQKIYDFKCPVNQQIKFMMLKDESVDFHQLASFLKQNSNSLICWVTDYGKMLKRNTRKIRVDVLARKFGIKNPDSENLLINLYAYGLLTDSLHQLAGNFSRAYMMEIIEHMLNSYPNYTYFNSVTGAPNQRAIVGSIEEYCPTLREME